MQKRHRRFASEPATSVRPVVEARSALLRATEVSAAAARVGFDWERPEDVLAKVGEELGELRHAMAGASEPAIRGELGDLLLAVVNLARQLGHGAEEALDSATARFEARFRYVVERLAGPGGVLPPGISLARMDALWNEAKANGVGVVAEE